jgi:hypothetical protein
MMRLTILMAYLWYPKDSNFLLLEVTPVLFVDEHKV